MLNDRKLLSNTGPDDMKKDGLSKHTAPSVFQRKQYIKDQIHNMDSLQSRNRMSAARQKYSVVIKCPRCDFQKAIDTDKCVNGSAKIGLKVKCRCGEIFKALLEKRKYSRSVFQSKGHVIIEDLSEIISGLSVLIRDISVSGVRIETDYPELFQVGHKVSLKIYCSNPGGAFISKDGTVNNIHQKSIGINFNQISADWIYRYCSLESEEGRKKFDHYLYL